jgi:small subunit ribosomal protein S2
MTRPPDAMVVIDLKVEEIAVREAQRLRIPIIGLVDTNCDPDGIEFVVPGNDDAIRSCALITRAIGDVVGEGNAVFRAHEEQQRKEAEEQARAAAAERARREAEEQAARDAAAQAEREAAEAARSAAAAAEAEAAEAATADAPPADPDEVKVHARGGGDRQAAEAEVAEAVQVGGRPRADARVPQSANTEVAPAQKDNVTGTSPDPAPPAEDLTPDPASPPVEPTVGGDPVEAATEAPAKPARRRKKAAPAEPAAAEQASEQAPENETVSDTEVPTSE